MKDYQDDPSATAKSGDNVLVLFHVHNHDDGSRDSTMIGVYTSQDEVNNGKDRLSARQGFDTRRASFETISVSLDRGPQSGPIMRWRTQRPAD
jgi:hypothetical protein